MAGASGVDDRIDVTGGCGDDAGDESVSHMTIESVPTDSDACACSSIGRAADLYPVAARHAPDKGLVVGSSPTKRTSDFRSARNS